MSTTADRVRELIAAAALTQAAFAERVEIDPTKLSKSLNGRRRFSSLDLALIAERFAVSVDWLLTGAEPEIATAARQSAGSSAATAMDIARGYATLRADLANLGYRQQWTLPPSVPLRGRWVDQGASLAEAALTAVRSAGRHAAEDLTNLVPAVFGIDVAVQPLGDKFDGLAVATPDARLIVVNITAIPARQRFTVAHELGHLLASDDQQIHRDENILGKQSKQGESEMRANAFAAALLMPEDTLREVIGDRPLDDTVFCRLATDLQVSPSSLAYRLETLRMVDGGTAAQWRTITGLKAAQVADKSATFAQQSVESLTPRPPSSLVRDTFAAYQAGDVSLRPYAHLVGVDTSELRRQFAAAGQK